MNEKITTIKPQKTLNWEIIREVWEYRELLYFFVWRDLKVRYKQTVIGIAWAVFQPLLAMVIFTIFFGYFVKMPTDGVPYPIFVFSGLLIWQFFSGAVTDASNCLVYQKELITKVYFPRLLMPLAATTTRLIDFFFASLILIVLMVYYGYTPRLTGLFILPLLLLITYMAAFGAGLFLAALNVKYRDVRYILPYFIQIILFITPVIYPASLTGIYSWFLAMNPLTGVIKAIRSALFADFPQNWLQLGISGAACLFILLIGFYYFKRTERYFADIV
jgi:lipopolysaccharide transport system permease protein